MAKQISVEYLEKCLLKAATEIAAIELLLLGKGIVTESELTEAHMVVTHIVDQAHAKVRDQRDKESTDG